MVPRIVMMTGGTMGHTPIDVFQLLAVAFILVRYLAGDYGRRQLFWDGAEVTTIALLVTSLPDLAMLVLGRGLYSAPRVLGSWLLLIFLVPVMRQGARVLMSRMGIWQIPTVMIGAGPEPRKSRTRSAIPCRWALMCAGWCWNHPTASHPPTWHRCAPYIPPTWRAPPM